MTSFVVEIGFTLPCRRHAKRRSETNRREGPHSAKASVENMSLTTHRQQRPSLLLAGNPQKQFYMLTSNGIPCEVFLYVSLRQFPAFPDLVGICDEVFQFSAKVPLHLAENRSTAAQVLPD